MSRPPVIGAWRALWLLFSLAVRRWRNRFTPAVRPKRSLFSRIVARFRPAAKSAPGAPTVPAVRQATPGKGGAGIVLFIFIGVVLVIQGYVTSTRLVGQLSDHAEGGTVVDPASFYSLKATQDHLDALARAEKSASVDLDHVREQREQARTRLWEFLLHSSDLRSLEESERITSAQERLHLFEERGMSAFRIARHLDRREFFGTANLWPAPHYADTVVRMLGVVFLWFGVCLVFLNLGSGNQDLGRVEWSLEWLLGLPVPTRVLFAAKLAEYAIINPFVWFIGWPLALVMYCAAGHGWLVAATLAAVAVLLLSVTVSAIRLVAETVLRLRLSLHQLKNLQAFCTVSGLVMMILLFWAVSSQPVPALFLRLAPHLPEWLTWTPFSLPTRFCSADAAAFGALAVYALVLPWLAVVICERAVRGGLLAAGGVYQGRRRPVADAAPQPRGRLRGVIAKDVTLLLRDRNFLVQTLVVPVLVVGMQVMINPAMLTGITHNYHHAATFAFMLGAYVLMASAFAVLAIEGPALWMLYTFPRELSRVLIAKTMVWCVCAMLYAAAVLIAAAVYNPHLDSRALGDAAVALAGVGIYAFIAAGIGALGTDPLAQEVRRKIAPTSAYLYMVLAGLFAYAIYNPSVWGRLVQLVLSCVLAYALWQKLRDRLPYLLDPVDRPPPRVGFSDGMFSVLAFFVIQGLVGLGLLSGGVPAGPSLAVAFVVAGIMAGSGTLLALWRQQVPDLLRAVGLRRQRTDRRGGLIAALFVGLIAGGVGAGFGALYLEMVEQIPALRDLRAGSALAPVDAEMVWWFAVLAVFAAPVFEEFIFRGLVYRGLRRSLPVGWAACFSAAVFACVHPPLSALPVFGLGLLAALAFEFSGWLLAPMVAHMTYNLAMVLLQLG